MMGSRRSNRRVPTAPEHDLNSYSLSPDRDLSKLSEESRMMVEIIMDKFDNFSHEISAKLELKNEKIANLEKEVENLRKQNIDICDRLDSIETNERNNSIVISGKALPPGQRDENTVNVARTLIIDSLKIKLSEQDITSAHRLGRKLPTQQDDLRRIVVKFSNTAVKQDLLSSCRTVKPPRLFFSDYLTPTRSEILFSLRQAKRKYPNIVAACGSQSSRVFVFVKSDNTGDRNAKIFINSKLKLSEFCTRSLGSSLDQVMADDARTT